MVVGQELFGEALRGTVAKIERYLQTREFLKILGPILTIVRIIVKVIQFDPSC